MTIFGLTTEPVLEQESLCTEMRGIFLAEKSLLPANIPTFIFDRFLVGQPQFVLDDLTDAEIGRV